MNTKIKILLSTSAVVLLFGGYLLARDATTFKGSVAGLMNAPCGGTCVQVRENVFSRLTPTAPLEFVPAPDWSVWRSDHIASTIISNPQTNVAPYVGLLSFNVGNADRNRSVELNRLEVFLEGDRDGNFKLPGYFKATSELDPRRVIQRLVLYKRNSDGRRSLITELNSNQLRRAEMFFQGAHTGEYVYIADFEFNHAIVAGATDTFIIGAYLNPGVTDVPYLAASFGASGLFGIDPNNRNGAWPRFLEARVPGDQNAGTINETNERQPTLIYPDVFVTIRR